MTSEQEIVSRPKCLDCGNAMLPSYCIAYNEFVCIPCGFAAPYFNSLKRINILKSDEEQTRSKYEDDINYLSFTKGGAVCKGCRKSGGNNCKECEIPKNTMYWGKRDVFCSICEAGYGCGKHDGEGDEE